MVVCPQCTQSAAVDIVADVPAAADAPANTHRWRARCGDCDTEWVFSDHVAEVVDLSDDDPVSA